MKIQPEHIRKAHVNAYAGEIQFKLGFMIAIWLLVFLTACSTPKLYAELELGHTLAYTHPALLPSPFIGSDPTVHIEAGLEWERGFHCGVSHDSHLRNGFPFNNEQETWRDELRCGIRFGGY